VPPELPVYYVCPDTSAKRSVVAVHERARQAGPRVFFHGLILPFRLNLSTSSDPFDFI
jgi:hypothetical protein